MNVTSIQSQLAINKRIITHLHMSVVDLKADLKDVCNQLEHEYQNPNPHNGKWISNLTEDKNNYKKWLANARKGIKRYTEIQKTLKKMLKILHLRDLLLRVL